MLFEIRALGFEAVELSFNLSREMVNGALAAVSNRQIRVSSVHNYCPVPDDMERQKALPDCFSMSSPDPSQRAAAVRYAKKSIDTAAELGAKAVVLHCGRVEMPDMTRDLIELCLRGKREDRLFGDKRDLFIAEREAIAGAFFANTLRSLEELERYASFRKIKLGIENRFYYREIPSFEETAEIFDRFSGSCLCFWYDTGHGRIMENLGFAGQGGFLNRYSSYLGGMHLHNVRDYRDHLPPAVPGGEIDFRELRVFMRNCPLRVIEAHHPASAAGISGSLSFLEGIINE
ncbi:MAG: sugar phosphate isomerase/epimerase [Candidatus Omnitrophota bacterium]